MEREEYARLMALKQVKGLGNKRLIELTKKFGSLEKLINAEFADLHEFTFIKKETFEEIHNLPEIVLEEARNTFDYCFSNNIAVISFFDKEFPCTLKQIPGPPSVIFAKGKLGLLEKPAISIVGSRASTEKSVNWAFERSKELSKRDYVIVSGAAKGVDTSAHNGALSYGGDTIAVLGSGFDWIYPKENEPLVKEIIERGLIISEYPPHANITRVSLLERNRITSGLGKALLLVTATEKGGSISQVNNALSQQKPVFVPSLELELEPSAGISHLIIEKQVSQITGVDDLIELLSRQRL